MSVNIFIQDRMGSSRLPGKSIMPLAGRPMLGHVLDRASQVEGIEKVVVLMPDKGESGPIVDLCISEEVEFFMGSEKDVLGRFVKALEVFPCDYVVRLTADNPLFDFRSCSKLVDFVITHDIDYGQAVSYSGSRSEIVAAYALRCADRMANNDYEREHVTPFVINSSKYHRYFLEGYKREENFSVDTKEDYDFMKKYYEKNYKGVPIEIYS